MTGCSRTEDDLIDACQQGVKLPLKLKSILCREFIVRSMYRVSVYIVSHNTCFTLCSTTRWLIMLDQVWCFACCVEVSKLLHAVVWLKVVLTTQCRQFSHHTFWLRTMIWVSVGIILSWKPGRIQEFFGGGGFRVLEKASAWEFSNWQVKKTSGWGVNPSTVLNPLNPQLERDNVHLLILKGPPHINNQNKRCSSHLY